MHNNQPNFIGDFAFSGTPWPPSTGDDLWFVVVFFRRTSQLCLLCSQSVPLPSTCRCHPTIDNIVSDCEIRLIVVCWPHGPLSGVKAHRHRDSRVVGDSKIPSRRDSLVNHQAADVRSFVNLWTPASTRIQFPCVSRCP